MPDHNPPTNDFPENEAKPKRKRFLQVRLWMLLLLFIPAGYLSLFFYDKVRPPFHFTESQEEFMDWNLDSRTELDFTTTPNGLATASKQPINQAYQSLGVSFRAIPVTKAPDLDWNSPEWLTPKSKDWIGISGYGFKFPQANYPCTIAPFEAQGQYHKRFRGRTLIRFHAAGDPTKEGNVHQVAFYAARLNTAETLRVRLYSTDGELIGEAFNQTPICVFMGCRTRHNIGLIEIEATGSDKDYAIANLIFSKQKPQPAAPNE